MKVSAEDAMACARLSGIELQRSDAESIAARISDVRNAILALDQDEISGVPLLFDFQPHARDSIAREPAPILSKAVIETTDRGRHRETDDLIHHDIAALSTMLAQRVVSPVEVTRAYLDRIEQLNNTLRAYITITPERALEDAQRAEREIMAGQYRGRMHGVPVGHKDLILTKGIRTTFHTDHYKDFIPETDAAVVGKLDGSGSIFLGKLNTYELGSGDGDVFGPALNPWDVTKQPGGSSSGSAVAVSANLAAGTTGTDAGGSIRVPAAFCGVIGLKPTFGVVSRFPESWCSVSVVGPITKSALDAAIMLEWMAGPDPRDPYSAGVSYARLSDRIHGDIHGLTIGVPRDWMDAPIHGDVEVALDAALAVFRDLGVAVKDIELPHAYLSEPLGALIAHVECFGKYRHLLAKGARLGVFFKRLLVACQMYSAADFLQAQRARRIMIEEVQQAHQQVDLIFTPTVPYPAFTFGQTRLELLHGDVNPRTMLGRYTRLSNLTGYPSISVPCGFTDDGMPLAFQLMGRPFEESTILNAAVAYEEAVDWRRHMPDL